EEVERGVDEHYKEEEHEAYGEQGLAVQIGGIAHLAGDGGGEELDAREERRHVRDVAGDHEYGHGLAYRAADAENDCGGDAALRGGRAHTEIGLYLGGAERKARLLILTRHGVERGLRDGYDARQYHDGEDDYGGEQAVA